MRKLGFLSVLLLAAACKGTDPVAPPVTTTVTVSSSAATIGVNETAQASAIVKDQNGSPLTGKTVTWTSLNQNIATVTSAGLIRGVAAGTATIQGTVDGINGTATVTVVAPAASCVGGVTTVDIAVGSTRVVSATESKGCVKIASTAAGSQYVVIGGYTSSTPDQILNYTLKSDEGETVPNTTILSNPMTVAASMPLRQPQLAGSLQMSFENKLRRLERTALDVRAGRRAYAERTRNVPGVRLSLSVAIPAVGDKTQFKVPKSCASFSSVTATVRYISTRSILYTDDGNPSGGFTDQEFQEIGTEFDNLIYPTDVDYFGTPLDQDNNSRVVILYTKEVNALTPAGNPNGFVGGFFFAGDLFPVAQCAQSNLAELFYVLAPDPEGTVNGNRRTTASVRQGTRGTIAHEFQHMINASERFRSPIEQDFEDVWLDEALSHFAEDLNGRALKGLNETGNYTTTQILPSGGSQKDLDDFNAFFFQNFARFQRYLVNPGQSSGISFTADTSLAARGAAWALLRYTADHYSPSGNIKAFTKALAGGPLTGVNNLTSRAGGVPFDTLAAGWMVANYADDVGIPNLPVKYTYKTYDMRSQIARVNPPSGSYPLVVQDLSGSGVVITGLSARSGSGNYFRFTRAAGGPARSFRFLNPDGATAVNFASAVLIVLRSQ